MTFEEGLEFFSAIPKVRRTLQMIVGMGLGYLTFGQPSPTLSGGEAQRVKIATQFGSGLVGMLYVLDEPSIGLHARDCGLIIESLKRLRDGGNTVIVVEHDLQTIGAADHILKIQLEKD